jgi:hypothetical protein
LPPEFDALLTPQGIDGSQHSAQRTKNDDDNAQRRRPKKHAHRECESASEHPLHESSVDAALKLLVQ